MKPTSEAIRIDTGPLPPVQAAAAHHLLTQLLAENQWIDGLALTGSYGRGKSPLPLADVDINYLGAPGEQPTTLRKSQELRVAGVDFHFSNRWYGARIEPTKLGLSQIAVVYRWHCLWERQSAITDGQKAIRDYLAQPDWRRQKLAAEFEARHQTLARLRQLPSWREKQSGEWDFFLEWCFLFTSLLWAVDLRATSLSRKSLSEVIEICHAVGIPEAAAMAWQCVGVHDFTVAEAAVWGERAARACSLVSLPADSEQRHDHRYVLAGMQEMIRRGEHQAAVYPMWRTFRICCRLLGDTEAGHQVAAQWAELAKRLGQATDIQFVEKIEQSQQLLCWLESKSSVLFAHQTRQLANDATC